MKNSLFLTTIVFFCFLTNVYAENGHVDLKYLSENHSSLGLTQNLSGFGIEVYKNFKKESDGENYVSYIEKSSREKNWKKDYLKNVKRELNQKLLKCGKIGCPKRERKGINWWLKEEVQRVVKLV